MSKNEKISANKITAFTAQQMKDPATLIFKIGDEEITVIVKRYIPYESFAYAVESVSSMCFMPDGSYCSYAKNLAKCVAILDAYTNIKTDIALEKLYSLIENTDIMDEIVTNIPNIHKFDDAVDEAIEYKKQQAITKKDGALLSAVAEKESSLANLFSALATVLDSIVLSAENGKKAEEAGIDFEFIKNAFETLRNVKEPEIAHAVLDFQVEKAKQEMNGESDDLTK